ncbi:MAG: GNAT family N-acetyltransferase [Clostridiales bacterium]|nr:GNAT family N-acetyltransferase [Clostridiales bacterium]
MNAEVDISKVVIITERLTLRHWKPDDLYDLYEYASVDGVGQMAGWLPHQNVDESREILNRFIDGKNEFAIEFNGKAIGSLGINQYNEEELPEYKDKMGCEIGYVLSKDYWGRGLMPEAVQAVTMYLFEALKLDFIVCGHFLDNLQSMRVQEKCGFEHRKIVKYETRYGIVKNCWLSVLERAK